MFRDKTFGYILAGILLILNIMLLYFYNNANNSNKVESMDQAFSDAYTLKTNLKIALESDGKLIDIQKNVVGLNSDTILLSVVFNDSNNYIVFRYSEFSCPSCISTMAELLYEVKNSMKSIKIILLPYYEKHRDMIINNSSTFNRAFPIYQLQTNSIGLPIDDYNFPYLFYLENGKIARYVMLVDVTDTNFLRDYLQILINK